MSEFSSIQDQLINEMKISSALKYRRIHLSTEVDRDSIFQTMYFLDKLRDLDTKTQTKEPIEIIVDSFGGSVYSANALISKIEFLQEEGYTIITTVSGVAMSAGASILLCGSHNFRRAYRYATILLHQISSGSYGTLAEIHVDIAETERLWKQMKSIMVKNTNMTDEFLENMYKTNRDLYITAEQALEYGIIDQII